MLELLKKFEECVGFLEDLGLGVSKLQVCWIKDELLRMRVFRLRSWQMFWNDFCPS
jgi:hypothetical protein